MKPSNICAALAFISLMYSGSACAQLPFHDTTSNQGVLDQVVAAFANRAAAWQVVVMASASWLFWTLGTISLTWTMGMLALRKADAGDFFAEFVRFTLFFGFFFWLLQNGPRFADSIIRSLRQIGDSAAGTTGLSPSGVVDIGFMIWNQAIRNLSVWSPIDSVIGTLLSAAILCLLAVVALNMLVLLVSGWILMYAGIFFLGFGGSRWTSEMAINYFKTVLAIAVQLFAMILLVGIGQDLLSAFYEKMSKGVLNFEELGVMLVFCMSLLFLVGRVPAMMSSVVAGGHGASNLASIGSGAMVGVAAMAAAAASTAGASLAAGATGMAGGAQALMAAYSKASAAESSGGGGMSALAQATGGGAAGEAQGGGNDFAAAMDGGGGGSNLASGSPGSAASAAQKSTAAEAGSRGFEFQGKAGSSPTDGGSPKEVKRAGGMASAGGMAVRATKVAAGTASHLAQGSWDVAKGTFDEIRGGMLSRIGETTGGKIAAAITGTAEGPEAQASDASIFGGNSLASAEPLDGDAEIAAFRDRGTPAS